MPVNNQPPVALITGSARRVGACIAQTLHAAGFCVIIHFRHSQLEAEQLAKQLNDKRKNTAACLQADLDDSEAYETLIKKAYQLWGQLDVLINNASTFRPTKIGETNLQAWDYLFNSNLKAPFFLAQAAMPYLKKQRGCIINITDIHAQKPLKDYPVYSCAKAGLMMLTKALALECAPFVRVNAIAPGSVLWPEGENALSLDMQQKLLNKTLLKKQVSPNDIADTALFLINSPSITAQTIAVDNGRL